MTSALTPIAHPPETLEGWYALHQIYTCEKGFVDRDDTAQRESIVDELALELVRGMPAAPEGWSIVVRLIGSLADVMVIHFRPTLDSVGEAQRMIDAIPG